MLWEEKTIVEETQVPDDTVDLLFSIACRELPVDHAQALSEALHQALPWMHADDRVGIHQIHVAASQNGWERPQAGTGQVLCLSRRTKLTLRIPIERMQDAQALSGATLHIEGFPLTVGGSKPRPLSKSGTIFSRYVVSEHIDDEEAFLRGAAEQLADMQIRVTKALSGIIHSIKTPEGRVHTRSLLLADLKPEESIRLQRSGLGPHRKLGCGIFIPHKGVDPVKKPADDARGRFA